MRVFNFLRKGFFLIFRYPVTFFCQVISVDLFFLGWLIASGPAFMEEIVFYRALDTWPIEADIVGLGLMVSSVLIWMALFFRRRGFITVMTYPPLIFWLFVILIYYLSGLLAIGLLFAGPQVVLIAYVNLFFTIWPEAQEESPAEALTRLWRTGTLDREHVT